MSAAHLAEDAVSIRCLRLRGMAETTLRRQFATLATPRVRRFVFVRRVTLRGASERIGQAMQAALAKLAEGARDEILTFTDFPALALACAQAAMTGGLTDWHWRTLDLPPIGTPGEAVAALLAAYPLEAGAAVAALAERGLLAAVWRSMPEPAAARLTAALALAAGSAVPAWPAAEHVSADAVPALLLARAEATWLAALSALPPRAETVRAAVMLALLRWAPSALSMPDHPAWPALLARLTRQAPTVAAEPTAPVPAGRAGRTESEAAARSRSRIQPTIVPDQALEAASGPAETAGPASVSETGRAARLAAAPAADDPDDPMAAGPVAGEPPQPHGLALATSWGGVLFLVNALQRLDIEPVLAAPGAPTGWRLLHDLGRRFGMPEEEALAEFLAAQDLDTTAPAGLIAQLALRLELLYRPNGPWPLPLKQPGQVRATETHLDLDLSVTEIDIALRLAGLDLDPGWVPWLGRVVSFHYDLLPVYRPRSF
jgi:hypothetical protein